jgi:TATA-box binding protein (TBP) (component of TFIID and TFIIIB)
MEDIDDDWETFCENDLVVNDEIVEPDVSSDAPKCNNIYISTKTNISYLNQSIDLSDIFWKLPIIPYHIPTEGIIKKQMKFNSLSQEELDNVEKNIKEYDLVEQQIITRIINPEGRIKFKDVRKISIGLCKKDITSYRSKKKGAFYNCFVVILRLFYNGSFKEIHIKVFNTGKLEIPGIQSDDILIQSLNLLIKSLQPHCSKRVEYLQEKTETVLINSNFSCGYYINRDKLYDILKYKYKINSAYDPCSYPGIQCEFYYDKTLAKQTGQQPCNNYSLNKEDIVKISFMIFRTGSVLIVGKCSEDVLNETYLFLKNLLESEYENIGGKTLPDKNIIDKNLIKRKKIRKKIIIIT